MTTSAAALIAIATGLVSGWLVMSRLWIPSAVTSMARAKKVIAIARNARRPRYRWADASIAELLPRREPTIRPAARRR